MTIINNALNILKITDTMTIGEKYYFYEQVSEAMASDTHTSSTEFLSDIKGILRNDMALNIGSLNDIDKNTDNSTLSNSSPISLFTSLISEHTV
jgi:hypothetical protein